MALTQQIAELRQRIDRLPRFPLGHLPTPLEEAPRFSRKLGGPRLFIKRDDCTGLVFGGNKTRHNEFLLGDALEKETQLFVWGAGVQSNNCRQTAAACARAGIDCHLVLGRGRPANGPDTVQGNLLLDHILGASYEIVDEPVGEDLDRRIDEGAAEFRAAGRRVYAWDRHVVKPLAAVSYVLCLFEIVEQSRAAGIDPSAIYVCSAGSTGAGLALGAKVLDLSTRVKSISPIHWPWDTQADMARIASETAALLDLKTQLERYEIDLSHEHIGAGYGIATPGCLEAIALLARTEAILLDPVYTGKALAGLIADIRAGRFRTDEAIVFVHTGGTPALFAMSDVLAGGIARKRQSPDRGR
ncbi:MAG: D-cysteine desulfhydrase family protein [Planctomycetes bacterium]|nr:D-cysteine desulfhydrase family protein [Planctomycetota bacterium]